MQPYVIALIQPLAESEQQSRNLFDTFRVGRFIYRYIGLRSLHSLHPMLCCLSPLATFEFSNNFFKKKIGREISILAFTTDWIFKIFSVSLSKLFRAKSQPMRFAAATTNLIFKARFIHRLNLYKKVYIHNLDNRKRFVKW